jgi:hypothetical protein
MVSEKGCTGSTKKAGRETITQPGMRLTNYYPVGRRGSDAASFFAGFVVATGGWAWLPIEVSY